MKYWKQGFYDEPQGGAVEITDEYYVELLDSQSDGFLIGESSNGYPIPVTPVIDWREQKISEITVYDTSDDINRFFINDIGFWFDKNERTSLMNLVNATEAAGETTFKLWTSKPSLISLDITIIKMKQILVALENYAKKCYDVTQEHKAAVYAIIDESEVENYNFKSGYPDKLSFEL